jgi:hypothetical protein
MANRTSGVAKAEPIYQKYVPVQKIREAGENYCKTQGSAHYKAVVDLEPIDLMMAKGIAEDFFIGNIIKYATRFKKTRNNDDLKKAADYAHLACGLEIVLHHQEMDPWYKGGNER